MLGGVRYRMFATTSLDYLLEPTLSLLADATGLCATRCSGSSAPSTRRPSTRSSVAAAKLDKPQASRCLKAESSEAHADKRMSPRLWASEVA